MVVEATIKRVPTRTGTVQSRSVQYVDWMEDEKRKKVKGQKNRERIIITQHIILCLFHSLIVCDQKK